MALHSAAGRDLNQLYMKFMQVSEKMGIIARKTSKNLT